MEKERESKVAFNAKEKTIAFIYVTLVFLVVTLLCCVALFYYNETSSTYQHKEYVINKMDRVRHFQVMQSKQVEVKDSIFNKIKDFKPSVNASYEENDIKFFLNEVKHIYEERNYDERYKIFLQYSNFYNMWFADKKELWSKKENVVAFKRNLEECEIGLNKRLDEVKSINR